MVTTNKKRGRPELAAGAGATSNIRIRVTPDFKGLVLLLRTQLDASEAELIIRAVNELKERLDAATTDTK